MKSDEDIVSQGSPPEEAPATTGGVASLTAAMNAVLKAVKPMDALIKAQAQSIARRNALYETFKPLCELPNTMERSLIERFVMTAEVSYLAWLEAYEATEGHKRNLLKAEQELQATQKTLKEAIEAARKITELKGDATLVAAGYMLDLLDSRRSQVEGGKAGDARIAAEVSEEAEIPLAKLRAAAVDFLLTEALIHAKHAVLKPIVDEIYTGANLASVALPVRPLEEEIVRYLSNLENNLQRQQESNRKGHPLLKERLTLVAQYDAWRQAWDAAVKEAEADDNPHKAALLPHIWALRRIIELVVEKSDKYNFNGHHFYDKGCCKNPDSLEIHDRPRSTAVENDQIDYLRKQMRVVAFAVAHREEATFTLKKFDGSEVTVTPSGVQNAGNWSECLAWYEDLRLQREAAELETLSRSTKVDLLKKTVEHFTDKAKDEMVTLYKSFNAMIPRNGPTPANELRKLLDQAAWICKPLEKEKDYDRY
jgi:hypothetical protein